MGKCWLSGRVIAIFFHRNPVIILFFPALAILDSSQVEKDKNETSTSSKNTYRETNIGVSDPQTKLLRPFERASCSSATRNLQYSCCLSTLHSNTAPAHFTNPTYIPLLPHQLLGLVSFWGGSVSSSFELTLSLYHTLYFSSREIIKTVQLLKMSRKDKAQDRAGQFLCAVIMSPLQLWPTLQRI